VILRILGEGQFEVGEDQLDELNRLDDAVQAAVEAGDQESFGRALAALITGIRTGGTELPADYLGPSDLVLPGPDSSIEEVREILSTSEQGLIPG
jgi:hypothetical protein